VTRSLDFYRVGRRGTGVKWDHQERATRGSAGAEQGVDVRVRIRPIGRQRRIRSCFASRGALVEVLGRRSGALDEFDQVIQTLGPPNEAQQASSAPIEARDSCSGSKAMDRRR
jgi:hypothetical protein